MLKKLLNKKLNYNEYIIFILIIFFLHLFTLNWYPTNFEGAYSKLAYFFSSNNKPFLIDSYFNVQANTIIFSLVGSLINNIITFLSPEISLRILSASSYFFLIFSFKNFLNFLKKEENLFLFILLISNPLIWYYGHRIYVDLFAFSIGLFGFSVLINNIESKKYFFKSLLWITFSILLKPFNLIFLPISFIFLAYKSRFYSIISFIFPIFVFFIFLFINKYYFNFFLTPDKFISDGSIFIKLEKINIIYVLNIFSNFIYYIGYLGLITFPLIFKFDRKYLKINFFFKFIIIFLISIVLSKFLSDNYGEINLGPIQKYFSLEFYKLLICLNFTYLVYLIFSLKNIIKKKFDLKKAIFFIFIILIYLFALSFLKLSQRYLLLVIPFFYCLIFMIQNSKYIYLLNFKINLIIILMLLLNYNIQSNLTSQIFLRMQEKNILFQTHPGPLLPHLMHEYQHLNNYKKKNLMYFDKETKYKISDQIPKGGNFEVFSYHLLGLPLKEIYLVEN